MYEYFVGHDLTEGKLNELGAQGWELVAVVPVGISINAFWLKRKK